MKKPELAEFIFMNFVLFVFDSDKDLILFAQRDSE
jgi:hypothetical protein